MARAMNAWLQDVRPNLPEGVEIHVMKEVWSWISEQFSVLVENGISGLVLVIGVLLVFLSGRVAGWVAVGIPVSFALALAIYWGVFDGRIQILSLIAFIMALGIVVDDAIVVGEDAVSHFEDGMDAESAAIAGAKRMFVPVMTASLTTLAAFAPLMLFGGPMGEAILTLPTVLLCIIIASLIECFLVLPHHLARSLEKTERDAPSRFRQWFDGHFEHFREVRFRPVLKRALDWPGATVCTAVAAVLIAFALIASQRVGVNFVTNVDLVSIEAAVQYAGAPAKRTRTPSWRRSRPRSPRPRPNLAARTSSAGSPSRTTRTSNASAATVRSTPGSKPSTPRSASAARRPRPSSTPGAPASTYPRSSRFSNCAPAAAPTAAAPTSPCACAAATRAI